MRVWTKLNSEVAILN